MIVGEAKHTPVHPDKNGTRQQSRYFRLKIVGLSPRNVCRQIKGISGVFRFLADDTRRSNNKSKLIEIKQKHTAQRERHKVSLNRVSPRVVNCSRGAGFDSLIRHYFLIIIYKPFNALQLWQIQLIPHALFLAPSFSALQRLLKSLTSLWRKSARSRQIRISRQPLS